MAFGAPFPAGGSIAGVHGEYVSSAAGVNQNTFGGLSFGEPASNRSLVAVVLVYSDSGVGISIGGVGATIVAAESNGDMQALVAVASVPEGSSGVVDVSYGSGSAAVNLYAIYGNSSEAPVATAGGVSSPFSGSLSLPAGAFAIAAGAAYGSGNTWTGVNLDNNESVGSSGAVLSSASGQFDGASTLTVTGSVNVSSGGPAFVAAAWGP
jgi:hypothetical protein